MTYENNMGVYNEEFIISGIWDGYGDKSVIYVSKEFYEQTGYNLEYDGILCIKLKSNYVISNPKRQEISAVHHSRNPI